MYCTNCGAVIADNSTFCTKCGAIVNPAPAPRVTGQILAPRPAALVPALRPTAPMGNVVSSAPTQWMAKPTLQPQLQMSGASASAGMSVALNTGMPTGMYFYQPVPTMNGIMPIVGSTPLPKGPVAVAVILAFVILFLGFVSLVG